MSLRPLDAGAGLGAFRHDLLPVTAATAQVIERGAQGGVVGAIIGGIVGGGRGIADMLETGNTPDFDVVGGVLVRVENWMIRWIKAPKRRVMTSSRFHARCTFDEPFDRRSSAPATATRQ